jgi:uncharacterized protein (TIGR03546 family)
MLLMKLLKKLIAVLHSEIAPGQIAGGVALGAMIGLLPFFSLLSVVLFLLLLIINVNLGAAFLAMAVFGLLGFLIDPLANQVGYALLVKIKALAPLWTSLYNMPVVPFTRFNNTVVLGNLIAGIVLFIPIFVLSKRFIVHYRTNYRATVENWKVVKLLKLTSLFNIIDRYR